MSEITVEMVVRAPRAVVFAAWADARELRRWWAPKGWSTPHLQVDFRVGGTLHFCMRSPDGQEVWAIGVYRRIDPPRTIVYASSFSDATGAIVERAGYPREGTVTVTFDEVAAGTLVRVRHEGLPEGRGELEGWHEMLARLGEHLGAAR